MPAQVVAVQRSRPRAFAILRAAPAWIRALTTARSRSARRSAPSRNTLPPDSAHASGLDARGTAWPRLVWAPSGGHRCVACGLCQPICPAAALWVESEPEAREAPRARRFELEPGRCIGCGLCVEVCPEQALVMRTGGGRVGVGAAPDRLQLIDLLQIVETAA